MVSGRLVGLQGRLARPFWGLMGIWAVLCGALASNRLRWGGEGALTLALTLILAEVAWGSLWDLTTGTEWFRPLAEGWPPARPASLAVLPYTQPDSPGGRLFHRLNRLAGWWREAFWPTVGPALLGLLAAVLLTAVLTLLLPDRLRPLNAALAALVGLGVAQRRRGRDSLLGQAAALVGLGWLAGHAALAEMSEPSWLLAFSFALAAWGALRVAAGRPGGTWLLNGGQGIAVALLAALKQPLAAGAVGLLLCGQAALQLRLPFGGDPARIARRTWPWFMAAMLAAALSVP